MQLLPRGVLEGPASPPTRSSLGRLPHLLPLALPPGCPGLTDKIGEGEGEGEDPYVVNEEEVHIDEGYLGELEVEINSGMTNFLITAQAENKLYIEQFVDPDGHTIRHWEDWDGQYDHTVPNTPH